MIDHINTIIPIFSLLNVWEILLMTPRNMILSFMYLVDIIKDTLQLLLLLITVGGISFVLHNWASFSSVVSLYLFLIDVTDHIYPIVDLLK